MYNPSPIKVDDIKLPKDLEDLAELIAKNVHDNWAKQRISEGWHYGEKRDDDKKVTPCLVPYEELSDCEKQYDRITALGTLKLITKLGYIIVKYK